MPTLSLNAGVLASRRSPLKIPGLTLWLDAARLTLNDNDAVGSWTDFSGKSFHATQATTALKPLFKTNILNGKPIVRFDGTDDLLSIPHDAALNASEVTIVVVLVTSQAQSAPALILGKLDNFGSPTNSPYEIIRPGASGGIIRFAVSDGAAGSIIVDSTINISDGGWRVFTFRRETAADEGRLFLNGVSNASATDSTTGSTDNTKPIRIGRTLNDAVLAPFQGDMAEILLYTRALTTVERTSVESYLRGKWGI